MRFVYQIFFGYLTNRFQMWAIIVLLRHFNSSHIQVFINNIIYILRTKHYYSIMKCNWYNKQYAANFIKNENRLYNFVSFILTLWNEYNAKKRMDDLKIRAVKSTEKEHTTEQMNHHSSKYRCFISCHQPYTRRYPSKSIFVYAHGNNFQSSRVSLSKDMATVLLSGMPTSFEKKHFQILRFTTSCYKERISKLARISQSNLLNT